MTVSKELVPLSRVVSAALIDSFEDVGKSQQLYFHWAAREFKDLNAGYLKLGKRHVTLSVNSNTHTASLPADFKKEVFVGVLHNGKKYPLSLNYNLVDSKNIEEIECEDACPKCKQSKSICNDLQITETVNIVTINGVDYEETITKKLYPNGDYYLETNIPYQNYVNEVLEVRATGVITISELGGVGDSIEVIIDDAELGFISLGLYKLTNSDTTIGLLTQNIVNALSADSFGYSVTKVGNTVSIKAPVGYGSSMNNGIRLSVIIIEAVPEIFDNSFNSTFK